MELALGSASNAVGNLTSPSYNNIVVTMIPALVGIPGSPWNVLPPGIHAATLAEIEKTFT
jgi:hypothetical protein